MSVCFRLSLYRGWFPVISSLCCSNFVYFYTFNTLKKVMVSDRSRPGKDLLMGFISGDELTQLVAWHLCVSGWVIKHNHCKHRMYQLLIFIDKMPFSSSFIHFFFKELLTCSWRLPCGWSTRGWSFRGLSSGMKTSIRPTIREYLVRTP